ncbi:MAG: hypothetical protein ACKVX7_03555 [Planctomycetota bacterium]
MLRELRLACLTLIVATAPLGVSAREIGGSQPPPEKPAGVPAMPLVPMGQKDAPDPAAPVDPIVAEVDAIKLEYREAMTAYSVKYRAAKEEEREALKAERPQSAAYIARVQKIADAHPKTLGALRALSWIFTTDSEATARAAALQTIMTNHIADVALGEFVITLGRNESPEARAAIERALAESPHDRVRGAACIGLAQWLEECGEKAQVTDIDLQVERLYERVVAQYADQVAPAPRTGTLGDMASANLFERRNLVVSKPVPDITGSDTDGVAFKLSDYRGKVVLLDFWGHW